LKSFDIILYSPTVYTSSRSRPTLLCRRL